MDIRSVVRPTRAPNSRREVLKLAGSAPEGTTLFAVSKGEQYVLPDLEQTKVVDTDQVWLAREFWRTGEDYDNTRKYA